MHVLVLPSWFEGREHPTLGSFFKDQARALARQQCQVGLIYPIPISLTKLKYFSKAEERQDETGFPILSQSYLTIPVNRTLNIKRRIQQFEKLYLRYVAKHGKPDLLHAHSCALGPAGAAGIAAHHLSNKYQLPYIITEHASAFHTGYYQAEDLAPIKQAFHSASAVIAVSQSLKKDLQEFGVGGDIQVLGNIVDVDLFRPTTEPRAETKQDFRFIVVAYLRPIKRIDLIIRAFAQLHKQTSEIHLDIVGDGEQRGELQKLVMQLGVSEYVTFHGEQPRSEVARKMAAADCYLMTSTYETFAVVVHEALASGIAVISSPCGGPEATLHTLGETVLARVDEKTLLEAMTKQAKLHANESQKKHRSEYIQHHFSQQAIGEALQSIVTNKGANFGGHS